jgi:hypothetical protein
VGCGAIPDGSDLRGMHGEPRSDFLPALNRRRLSRRCTSVPAGPKAKP